LCVRCRQIGPHIRQDIVLRHAFAPGVHGPKIDLGKHVAFVSGFAIPNRGLCSMIDLLGAKPSQSSEIVTERQPAICRDLRFVVV
jgi:hypothetical protein